MTETYTAVGMEAQWMMAFMPVPAVVMFTLVRRTTRQRPAFFWQLLPVMAYFLIFSLIGLPSEWIVAGACFGGGIAILIYFPRLASSAKWSWPRKWGMSVVFFALFCALGIQFITMKSRYPNEITLNDSSARFTFLGSMKTLPRSGFHITEITPRMAWFNIRQWGSWTSFSGTGSKSEMGPMFAGFDIYWGPQGLIRGDDLAVHFAHWAGVVPMVQSGDKYPYKMTPLPGFKLTKLGP